MEKRSPQGAVQGLCSSSMNVFALGIAFLGYWGFQNEQPWRALDAWVIVPAILGFMCLSYVPLVTTAPAVHDDTKNITKGRIAFLVGVVLVIFAMVASIFI